MNMKKYILFCLISITMMIFFSSCSDNDKEYTNVSSEIIIENASNNKTIQQMKEYNKVKLNTPVATRSIGGWLKKIFHVTCADVLGALKGIVDNYSTIQTCNSINPTLATIATVYFGLDGGIPASKHAWNTCNGLSLTTSQWNSLFSNVVDFCEISEVLNDTTFQNSIYVEQDTLFSEILLPTSLSHLKTVGLYHNVVLNSFTPLQPLNRDGTRYDVTPYQQPEEIEELLESSNFSSTFYSVKNAIAMHFSILNGFDIESFITANPYTSSNVGDTFDLFFDALDNIVTEPDDVLSLVNDYIDIIETNNEFSTYERTQVYLGFVVAAYSYNMWYHNMLLSMNNPSN